jgi:hypothetical protein
MAFEEGDEFLMLGHGRCRRCCEAISKAPSGDSAARNWGKVPWRAENYVGQAVYFTDDMASQR